MFRLVWTLVLGVLLGAPLVAPEPSPNKKEPFCPECWKFLDGSGDLDDQGRCRVAGRRPVEVEAVTVHWFWCPRHEIWHRRPCGRESSVATGFPAFLVTEASEPVATHAYCPEHRMISDLGFPGLACPACGKPLVAVDTVERRWYWCRMEQAWRTEPSPSNGTLNCCSERSGAVPAYLWTLPFRRGRGES
jgi:hypothetical protein